MDLDMSKQMMLALKIIMWCDIGESKDLNLFPKYKDILRRIKINYTCISTAVFSHNRDEKNLMLTKLI